MSAAQIILEVVKRRETGMASPCNQAFCLLTQHRLELGRHLQSITPAKDTKATLKKWFAEDPQRAKNLTFELDQFHIDLSKNLAQHARDA